jgi:phage-related protein
MTAQVRVEILGDAKSVQKAFNTAGKSVGGFQSAVSTAGGVIGGILGAGLIEKGVGAAVGFLTDAVGNASDLAEQTSKIGVVFGKNASEIETWSKTTSTAIGLSEKDAKTAAGTFGTLLSGLGFAPAKSAAFSKSLTTLAADMASFNNADVSDTLAAIQSGLRGEAEPLRKYGVLLDDAGLKAEAMALGIWKGKGPLNAQQKAQAALGLVMKQTQKQQGDFARTSDGLANTQRTNAAVMEDLSSKVGTMLLPAVTQLASFVATNVLPALMQLADALGPIIGQAVAALSPLLQTFAATVLPVISAAFAALAPIIAQVGGFIASTVIPAVLTLASAIQSALAPVFAKIGPLIQAWAPYFQTLVTVVIAFARGILSVLVPALQFILPILGTIIGVFLSLFTALGKLVAIFITLGTTIVNALAKALKPLLEFGQKIVSAIIDGIQSMAGKVIDAILALIPGPIKDVVGGILGVGGHAASAPAVAGRTTRIQANRLAAAGRAGTAQSVTMNVYTTGDTIAGAQAVVRALRRTARLNAGVLPPFATAPGGAGG